MTSLCTSWTLLGSLFSLVIFWYFILGFLQYFPQFFFSPRQVIPYHLYNSGLDTDSHGLASTMFYQLFFSPNMISLAWAVCLGSLLYWKTSRPFPIRCFSQKEWQNELKAVYFSASMIPALMTVLAEMQPYLIVPPLSNSSYMWEEELDRGGRIQYVRRRVPFMPFLQESVCLGTVLFFSITMIPITLLMSVKSYLKRKKADKTLTESRPESYESRPAYV